MDFNVLLKQGQKFAVDNAPLILTVFGAAGSVTTAVLTAKATFAAAKKIEDKQFVITAKGTGEKLDTVDKVKLVWTEYIPPVISCGLTVGAVVGANHLNSKRAAALAAAYAMSQNNLQDYKDKVAEKFGVKKEQDVRAGIAQDRVNKYPPGGDVVIVGNGNVLCKDEFSGRYFRSTVEAIKRAENEINFEIINSGYATVSDFYDRIGLKATSMSETFGWNVPTRKLELAWTAIITPEDEPCMAFDFNAYPIKQYGMCAAE